MNKIGFLFAGQGAQQIGMGKELANSYKSALSLFELAPSIVDFDIIDTIENGTNINETRYTQPSMFLASCAIYEALIAEGINPDAVAGLSLGEYGALYASGVISFAEGLKIVNKRAQIMSEAIPVGVGSMIAIIGKTEAEIKALITQSNTEIHLANFNCPGQVVVGGLKEQVLIFTSFLKENKVRAIPLNVSGPFHTPLLNSASKMFGDEIAKYQLSSPNVAFYENVTGKQESNGEEIKELLGQQISKPVRFEQIIQNMYNDGVRTFIEIGPGKALSGFVKKTVTGVSVYNVEDVETLKNTIVKLKESVNE